MNPILFALWLLCESVTLAVMTATVSGTAPHTCPLLLCLLSLASFWTVLSFFSLPFLNLGAIRFASTLLALKLELRRCVPNLSDYNIYGYMYHPSRNRKTQKYFNYLYSFPDCWISHHFMYLYIPCLTWQYAVAITLINQSLFTFAHVFLHYLTPPGIPHFHLGLLPFTWNISFRTNLLVLNCLIFSFVLECIFSFLSSLLNLGLSTKAESCFCTHWDVPCRVSSLILTTL